MMAENHELDSSYDHALSVIGQSRSREDFPEGGFSSWSVVAGCFSLITASYGIMFSVGIFQSYFALNQLRGFTDAQIGWIPGVFVFVGLILGIQVGPLFDRYGPTIILIAGSVGYVLSFLLLAQCHLYWQFMLSFGLLAGIGAACLSTVALSVIPHYFRARAGLAMGVALAGSGLGGVIFPLILRAGFNHLGWAWTMRMMALILGILCVFGIMLVKSRLPRSRSRSGVSLKCFKDSRFTWLTLGIFFLELGVYACLGLLPTFVIEMGFSVGNSSLVLSVMNVCSLLGTFANGYLADRFGRLNSLSIIPTIGVLLIFAIWLPFRDTLPGLYVFGALFGLLAGAYTNVGPTCVSQISQADEMGSRIGTCYSCISFASLVSIPLGGELLQRVGARNLIVTFGSLTAVALLSCSTARWACLGYKWRWRVII